MRFQPNDVVRHIPTGEEWLLVGVSRDGKRVIPGGYPFPSIADAADCELVERRGGGQLPEWKNGLLAHGMDSYVEKEAEA